MKNSNQKVFVGMSGGVDSSVAAYLLKEQGYDVVGVFLRCYNIDGCAERDAEDARRVAGQLNIPFYVWDFEEEYKSKVVEYMVEGYRKGITPNPDVMCNREIKFGLFYKKAKELGADFVATGHYVKKIGEASLGIAKDSNKDQSYFLWTLTPEQIRNSLFPVGDMLKLEVRDVAKKAGISTADKKDSQGICFLGKVSIIDFLKSYIPEKAGPILNMAGDKIGEHRGAHFYTVGQRHLGVDLLKPRNSHSTVPYFVSKKDVRNNVLIVAEGEDNESLFRKEINISELNFISKVDLPVKVLARVRYRQPVSLAILSKKGEIFNISFEEPQKFVAEGQSTVFYSEKGEMIGGGVIIQ